MVIDSEKEINMCLKCPLPECVNCLEHSEGRRKASVEELIQVMELTKQKLNDAQVANIMGVRADEVAFWRKQLGIPGYQVRKGTKYAVHTETASEDRG